MPHQPSDASTPTTKYHLGHIFQKLGQQKNDVQHQDLLLHLLLQDCVLRHCHQ